MRGLLILLINFYQRFISPYKGFRCAHAVYHHGPSCSSAVKTIIRQYGLLKGLPAIRARFSECKQAYLLILAAQEKDKDSKRKDPMRRDKPSRCERLKDQCSSDCITAPCDIFSSCRPGKGPGSSCDINPCDSSPCDAGPCDCSF